MKKNNPQIESLLNEVKTLSKKYKELTGKPLGITGEIAEFSAAKILGLKLALARQPGYDAVKNINGKEIKVQIKGRVVKPNSHSGRLGRIRIDSEWDTILLVLLDEDFEVISMYESDRQSVIEALTKPGSKSRNVRGTLSISKFKSISKKIFDGDSKQ